MNGAQKKVQMKKLAYIFFFWLISPLVSNGPKTSFKICRKCTSQ